MTKKINIKTNASFSELDWIPGELMAFDDTDFEWPSPLLLALPKKIVRGYEDSPQGTRLLYCPQNGEREEWTLYSEENMIGLWSPNYKNDSKVPHFVIIRGGFPNGNAYLVENALSGKETIQKYLQERRDGLDFYAECLESGKLVTERSQLEKLVQKLGLGFVLSNQLRFSK